MGITEKHWKETKKIDFGSETDAVSEEAKAWKTIWSAGQGVSNIHDSLRVSELIAKLKTEFTTAIKSQQELLSRYQ
jgi:nitronate monooxygenase